jgi:hypothetical protein
VVNVVKTVAMKRQVGPGDGRQLALLGYVVFRDVEPTPPALPTPPESSPCRYAAQLSHHFAGQSEASLIPPRRRIQPRMARHGEGLPQ